MQKIDVTITKLRLLLADILAKEQQLAAMRQQFRDQLRKAVDYSVYGDGSIDGSLGLMSEVQQRLAAVEGTIRNLGLVRARAERELESLQLTKRIEAAEQELGSQIRRLRQQINEASEQAARTLDRR